MGYWKVIKEVQMREDPKKQKDISAVPLTALLPFEGVSVSQMYPVLGLETPLCIPNIFHLLISNS